MKTLLIAFVLPLALASAAAKQPKQSDPEKYAAALALLLTDYQKQVSDKIAAEEAAYLAAAKFYDAAFRINVTDSLTEDRTSDSLQDLAALNNGRLTPSQLISNVNAYAQNDFDKTRSLYQMNIDSYQSYLSNLNSLEVDSQQIGVLLKALNDLAAPATLATRLKEVQAYQKSFAQQLHLSNCSIADSLVTIKTGQKTSLDAQIAKLPSNSPNLSALQSQSSALQTQITSLQTQRTNSGGYTPGASGVPGTCTAM
jgi:hypothetical protein